MSKYAIDISKHQSTFNARTAKAAGIDTVFCRCAYGTSQDIKWSTFAPVVRQAGMELGAYGFLTAHYTKVNGGIFQVARKAMWSQVAAWIDILSTQDVTSWVAVDEEVESGHTMALDAADNTALLNEACDLLAAAGFHPCVYCGASWAKTYIDHSVLRYPLWIAYYAYDPSDPDFDGAGDVFTSLFRYSSFLRSIKDNVVAWQFGRIGYGGKYGVGSANVDKNILYRSPADKEGKDDTMDYTFDTYKIGPVSGGDRRTMAALAESLSIQSVDDGDYLIVGPMSGGDRKTVLAKAQALLIGAEGYVAPVVEPEPEPEPEPTSDNIVIVGANEDQKALIVALAKVMGLNTL